MLIKLDFQSELYEIYKNFKISFNITKDYNVQRIPSIPLIKTDPISPVGSVIFFQKFLPYLLTYRELRGII